MRSCTRRSIVELATGSGFGPLVEIAKRLFGKILSYGRDDHEINSPSFISHQFYEFLRSCESSEDCAV